MDEHARRVFNLILKTKLLMQEWASWEPVVMSVVICPLLLERANPTEMVTVLAHEMMHGLGFGSNIIRLSETATATPSEQCNRSFYV